MGDKGGRKDKEKKNKQKTKKEEKKRKQKTDQQAAKTQQQLLEIEFEILTLAFQGSTLSSLQCRIGDRRKVMSIQVYGKDALPTLWRGGSSHRTDHGSRLFDAQGRKKGIVKFAEGSPILCK